MSRPEWDASSLMTFAEAPRIGRRQRRRGDAVIRPGAHDDDRVHICGAEHRKEDRLAVCIAIRELVGVERHDLPFLLGLGARRQRGNRRVRDDRERVRRRRGASRRRPEARAEEAAKHGFSLLLSAQSLEPAGGA